MDKQMNKFPTFILIIKLLVYHNMGYSQELLPCDTLQLLSLGNINIPGIDQIEISGIVKSKTNDSIFWMICDSQNGSKLFGINSDFKIQYYGPWFNKKPYIDIYNAFNIDWEDITIDEKNNIIIGDIGNNSNSRKDIVLYYVSEPSFNMNKTTSWKRLYIKYPDQEKFPDYQNFNFDAEGLFYARKSLFVLTKHRSDSFTKLYKVKNTKTNKIQPLKYIGKFNIEGQVTGADATNDGKKVIIITYNSIWLFEKPKFSNNYFKGNAYSIPIRTKKIESVCFKNDNEIIIVDEEKSEIFEVQVTQLKKVN